MTKDKTQNVTKLKMRQNSVCDETKKNSTCEKIQNVKCDKTQNGT